MSIRRFRSANLLFIVVHLFFIAGSAVAADGNRLPHLDSTDVWFPHKNFPKLITPQWVGEDGVECVVVLAIDDMREPAKYEAFLRPILQRLKALDGRAPVSIMTCSVKPDDSQLQSWLLEGLSLECHTFDHPCPLLAGLDISKPKATFDKCVNLLASVPNSNPVAFRTPCCDSLNTVSPRFYSEIFNKTTDAGHFLQLDSSVFILYSADDPDIPREWLVDPDGNEKFRKYIPRRLKRGNQVHDIFVNTIENYPYPYVIQNKCWEFPCMVPSDWSANHLHQPNNPDTIRDLKVALDITVQKQGVMNLVFHPHGWIKAEQVVDLIDHAVAKHGRKVKFLNFKECVNRLNQNVLGGQSLRDKNGNDNGVRMIDVTSDGFMDVIIRNESVNTTRSWSPHQKAWIVSKAPAKDLVESTTQHRFISEGSLPKNVAEFDANGRNAGLRFVDLNGDLHDDIVISNSERYGAWLFGSNEKRWNITLVDAKRGEKKHEDELPLIVREDGSDNGFFVKDRHLCWINESTADLPDLMVRISFDKLLGDRLPEAKSPEAAIQSMRVPAGYQIELVAHEPLTMDPVAFDWGPDGKLWIAEMSDYPMGIDGKGTPGGRIRYLEAVDSNGKYDKSTLFLDSVPFPNGVLAWKKGVLVSAAPDIFYVEDSDGDGKGDVREVLFTGFPEGNQQHRANGFTRGLDNWIYIANGDSGGTVTSAKTGKSLQLRGSDLRVRPETGEMEAVAGVTQFGRNRDDWGNWFGNNNSRPMWHYVLDDHYLRRNEFLAVHNLQKDVSITPGAAPVFPSSKTLTRFNDFHTANRFTSACGAIVYRDDVLFQLGEKNLSHVFVSEPVHNLVHHEVMTPDGCSFTSRRGASEEQLEFVSSTDNWFRPTMLRTGPDGALWIADMYRQVIEHPQWIPIEWQRKLNVRAGDDKGRIWRVFPVGTKPRQIPRLDQLTIQQLVAALDSPNGWQRDMVQQLLVEKTDPASIPLLRSQAQNSRNPLCRLHSLCTLDGMKAGLKVDLVSKSLTDSHPGIRRNAIRLLESLGTPNAAVIEELTKLVDDPDPQVRLQLAYSIGELKQPLVGRLLGRLARGSEGDSYLQAAVLSSLTRENLADVLEEVVKDGETPTGLLEQLLDQAVAFQHERAMIALLLRATQPAANGGYSPWQFSAVDRFLNSLARRRRSLNQWLIDLGADDKPIEARLTTMLAFAKQQVVNSDAELMDRVSAVRILGQSPDDVVVLGELLSPRQPPELLSAALDAIARLNSPEIATMLIDKYRSFGPSLRSQTCDVLLSRDAWQNDLLAALESKQLTAADLDAISRQRLLSQQSNSMRERAAKVLAVDLNTDRAKLVAEYLPAVRIGGDARHGRQLFEKRCAQCHKLGEIGHAVGPDLTALADKSAEVLMTAVLDPNRAVEARYLTFIAVTKAGVSHTGILATETASSLTLRAAEGKEAVLLRNEIDELQSTTKSLMPEGLERELTPSDAASLITYIRQNLPLPAMKKFPGNEPRLIQPDAQGALVLTPKDAEIYGPTIIIEDQYQNLGWWSNADDIVVWTINVPKPGIFTVEWTWACDPQAAGNSVTVQAFGKSFTRHVAKTAGWDDYQSATLGEIELPAGEVRVTLKPTSRPLPALADVKSLKLTRKK